MRSAAAISSAPVAGPLPVPTHPSRTARVVALALGLTSLAGLAACSGDASSEFSGDLFVESCSIGCNNGSNGQAVTCSIINVTENQEISILFSEPIDPASITPSTLQVTDTQNGTAPEGLRFVDPIDPRRVVFRPSISFEGGGIEFAFGRNETYEILIPGVAQGDAGPFIRSTEGNPNQSRMMCSIQTTEGIADIVPGNPVVEVSVDVVTEFDPMGEPLTVERRMIDSDGNNPVEPVWRDSKVYFEFNELMFLPTIADNTTMSSPFIRVQFDTDGLLSTAGSERFDIPGSYEFTVDQIALTTQMVFTPEGTIPSSGSDPANPRLLIVRIPSDVTDAAGNPVTSQTGGGILVAIPEAILFDEVFFPNATGETFDDTTFEDADATGANWAEMGILPIGLSGGSGRHGELRLDEGETVTLNTTSQDFPLTTVSQPDLIGNGPAGSYPRTITVTNGVFEFSKIILGAQSRLVIEGTNPARLLSRGSCNIEPSAVIDVSGVSAPAHDSTIPKVQGELDPARGGPNGAPGGQGADRWDAMQSTGFVGGLGGVAVPGSNRAGQPGGGVGGGFTGGAAASAPWPNAYPAATTITPANITPMGFNLTTDPIDPLSTFVCIVKQIGAPGGGGGYATNGSNGVAIPIESPTTEGPPGNSTIPPATQGGSNGALGLAMPNAGNNGYDRRILRWQNNHLVGGSSGSGGSNHPYGTANGEAPMSGAMCVNPDPFAFAFITRWIDHSAASGGGGGGAVELLLGRKLDMQGQIDARGGDGGSALASPSSLGRFAMPGGGGSGGSIRVRAREVEMRGNARISIGGGIGGAAPWTQTMGMESNGGNGANGLIRIEDSSAPGTLEFNDIAARVIPFSPSDPAASLEYLSVAPDFFDAASVGTRRPDSISGATSCWFRPSGSFTSLEFSAVWDFDVVLDDGLGGTITRPFNSTNAMNPMSWLDEYGNLLGFNLMPGEVASPIVIRFQGPAPWCPSSPTRATSTSTKHRTVRSLCSR